MSKSIELSEVLENDSGFKREKALDLHSLIPPLTDMRRKGVMQKIIDKVKESINGDK